MLDLNKLRLDPYQTLAHGFLVGSEQLVRLHTIKYGFEQEISNASPGFASGALRFDRTSGTHPVGGFVDDPLAVVIVGPEPQDFALRTDIDILLRISACPQRT